MIERYGRHEGTRTPDLYRVNLQVCGGCLTKHTQVVQDIAFCGSDCGSRNILLGASVRTTRFCWSPPETPFSVINFLSPDDSTRSRFDFQHSRLH